MAGEVSFETEERFSAGFAAVALALEVGPGFRVDASSVQRDDVQGLVELSVAAAVQAVSAGVA